MKALLRLYTWALALLIVISLSCGNDPSGTTPDNVDQTNLSIFFVNDQHGQINNFAKVKAIVDEARNNGNTILVSAGDIFAGNPIVDQFSQPGFPMVDIMNQVGFEVGVLGNHEFDFGTQVLQERVDQSQFPWILANVDASNSVLNQPDPFFTITVDDLRVTFLGLVETNGKENDIIPSTHPLRVADLSFQTYQDVTSNYANLKAQENADVLVALSHLGSGADRNLAQNFPFFDLIIGGHSHELIDETVNNTPIFQAGANLRFMGRIDLVIEDQRISDLDYTLINLDNATQEDPALAQVISDYNNDATFAQVVGQSGFNHQSADVGCFFTTALKEFMQVDFAIQNLGGIRAGIDDGPITRFEIFAMDPFNNRSVAFTKSVGEFENFFCQTGSRFFFTGIEVDNSNNDFQIVDSNGNPLPDDMMLTMGVNDFIPARFDDFFDFSEADIRDFTTAEAVIGYLETINSTINFEDCNRILSCN